MEVNEQILNLVLAHMEAYDIPAYDETTGKGLVRHVLIRYGFQSKEIMVCLVVNGSRIPGAEDLIAKLREISGMTSISLNINREKTNVILGRKGKLLWGQEYITDTIGPIAYQISPQSFYQVNPVQTQKLYEKALEYAGLEGNETVWDLYCGIGTISLFLAQKAKQVYGVEIVPAAIEDAKRNATLNHITNAEFFVGKAEEVLPEKYEKEGIYADVIVVDPPRKGCEESVLATMVKMQPKRIVYVSCDSATLARDLKYLRGEGYQVEMVQGVDQFPHTVHVETVVLLSHKKADSYIHIDVEFGEGEGKIPVDSIAKRAEAYMRGWRACFRRMRPSSLKIGSVAFISMARDALAKMTSSCTMILRSARIESVCSAVCWLRVERITSISFCSSSSSSRMSLFSFTIAIGSINKVEPVED